jgi:hypothetical protein
MSSSSEDRKKPRFNYGKDTNNSDKTKKLLKSSFVSIKNQTASNRFSLISNPILQNQNGPDDLGLLTKMRKRSDCNHENLNEIYKIFNRRKKTESSDYDLDSDDFLLSKSNKSSSFMSNYPKFSTGHNSVKNSFADRCFSLNEDAISEKSSQSEAYFLTHDKNDDKIDSDLKYRNLNLNEEANNYATAVSKKDFLIECNQEFCFTPLIAEESNSFKHFMNISDNEIKKNKILKNIKEIKGYENIDLEELHIKFSEIYKNKIKEEITSAFQIKDDKKSISAITTEMLHRKDEIDKKVNTIMKAVIQILLNLLFNYNDIAEIVTETIGKKLTKIISLQKMTGEKVDVDTLREFHLESLLDICIKNSLITNKKRRSTDNLEQLIKTELSDKTSFYFLFDLKFEIFLNLTFLEFSKSDFSEIKKFLADYKDDDPNKAKYEQNLLEAFYKRLTYLTADDVVPNNKSKNTKTKKIKFKVSKKGKSYEDFQEDFKLREMVNFC